MNLLNFQIDSRDFPRLKYLCEMVTQKDAIKQDLRRYDGIISSDYFLRKKSQNVKLVLKNNSFLLYFVKESKKFKGFRSNFFDTLKKVPRFFPPLFIICLQEKF